MVRKIKIERDGDCVSVHATGKPYVVLKYEKCKEIEGTHLIINVGVHKYRFNRFGKLIPPEDVD